MNNIKETARSIGRFIGAVFKAITLPIWVAVLLFQAAVVTVRIARQIKRAVKNRIAPESLHFDVDSVSKKTFGRWAIL